MLVLDRQLVVSDLGIVHHLLERQDDALGHVGLLESFHAFGEREPGGSGMYVS